MSLYFGPVRQVGYVVHDIEKAMRHWVDLGVGPWFYKEDVGTTEFRYHGKPSRLPKLSIALANSGDLQLELIQQRDDAPSLYLDSLSASGELAQHVAYWTADRFDEIGRQPRRARLSSRATPAAWARAAASRTSSTPSLPSAMVEISETTGGKGEYFDKIRRAAQTWDGSDPIRLPSAA